MVLRGYDRRREYWERMHHELDIIAHHGFASYFLTVAQVVDDVRDMGIRVAARGSGAGSWSTICWASRTPTRSSTGC